MTGPRDRGDGLADFERRVLDLSDQGHAAAAIADILDKPIGRVKQTLSIFGPRHGENATSQAQAATLASCDLVRAQLRAGQHVLDMTMARVRAVQVALPQHLVRPGIGDPSAFKLREAR